MSRSILFPFRYLYIHLRRSRDGTFVRAAVRRIHSVIFGHINALYNESVGLHGKEEHAT